MNEAIAFAGGIFIVPPPLEGCNRNAVQGQGEGYLSLLRRYLPLPLTPSRSTRRLPSRRGRGDSLFGFSSS